MNERDPLRLSTLVENRIQEYERISGVKDMEAVIRLILSNNRKPLEVRTNHDTAEELRD